MNTDRSVDLHVEGEGFARAIALSSCNYLVAALETYKASLALCSVSRSIVAPSGRLMLDPSRTKAIVLHFNGELTANVAVKVYLTPATEILECDDGLSLSFVAIHFVMLGRAERPNDEPVNLFGEDNLFTLRVDQDGLVVDVTRASLS